MFQLIKVGNVYNYQSKQYVCDTSSDLSSITDAAFADQAYCITDGVTYIFTGSDSWVPYGVAYEEPTPAEDLGVIEKE